MYLEDPGMHLVRSSWRTSLSAKEQSFPQETITLLSGRPLRVHSLRVLQHQLPVLLVERRQIPRPGGASAGLPVRSFSPNTLICIIRLQVDRRLSRPQGHGASEAHGRRVQRLQLPHHPQLHEDLPEGKEEPKILYLT